MRNEIIREIEKLELEKNIKVLYAVESGSRAWGFASTNSDWDVRLIYIHQQDWYLSIEDKKDNLEFILPNDIDISGWEIRKALKLFRKSNPPLLEWLRSPIVYQEKGIFANNLRVLCNEYFNPKSCLYHYYHMAKGNWEAYFKGETARIKKYFYVLRPLFACYWIREKQEIAPMEFDVLLNFSNPSNNVKTAIENLLSRKMHGEELDVENRIQILDEYIENLITDFETYLSNYNFNKTPNTNSLNILFRNTLQDTWK
jgi:predicted nucleotidyltransferase